MAEFRGPGGEEPPQFLLAHATRACAEMILTIEVDSSLLTALSPAMFLQIMTMVRWRKISRTLTSSDRHHICCLAVEYVKRHRKILDGNHFYALTSELYFPSDVKMAGLLAIDLLEITNLTGWETNRGNSVYHIMDVVVKKNAG